MYAREVASGVAVDKQSSTVCFDLHQVSDFNYMVNRLPAFCRVPKAGRRMKDNPVKSTVKMAVP